MSNQEFSDEFDVLYNNITSNQAPGLDEYEKSVFLTKAQDEIVKAYFDPRLNKPQEGFDGSERRQIDFSMILRTASYDNFDSAILDDKSNSKRVSIDSNIMMILNEFIDINRDATHTRLVHIEDWIRKASTSFTWVTEPTIPAGSTIINMKVTYNAAINAIALIVTTNDGSTDSTQACLTWKEGSTYGDYNFKAYNYYGKPGSSSYVEPVSTSVYTYNGYYYTYDEEGEDLVRNTSLKKRLSVVPLDYQSYSRLQSKPYRRPLKNQAWRLLNNTGDTNTSELIVGPNDLILSYVVRYIKRPQAIILDDLEGVKLDGKTTKQECELDPILHPEILQRAIELAKAAWQGGLDTQIALGQSSETNMGIVAQQSGR